MRDDIDNVRPSVLFAVRRREDSWLRIDGETEWIMLRPCPLCGSKRIKLACHHDDGKVKLWCEDCHLHTCEADWGESLITDWDALHEARARRDAEAKKGGVK